MKKQVYIDIDINLISRPAAIHHLLGKTDLFSYFEFFISTPVSLSQAGCMYVHGGVVNMSGNRRTGSLYKVWLVVPSLLEMTWEKLLKTFPQIAQMSSLQLLNLGLTHTLIQRLK